MLTSRGIEQIKIVTSFNAVQEELETELPFVSEPRSGKCVLCGVFLIPTLEDHSLCDGCWEGPLELKNSSLEYVKIWVYNNQLEGKEVTLPG